MFMLKLYLILGLLSTSILAKIEFSSIYDGEFNMDSSACWLEDAKLNIILYSYQQNEVKVKLNSKIINLMADELNVKESNLACNQLYRFRSEDKNFQAVLKIEKEKKSVCHASLKITSGKEKIQKPQLRLRCSK